MAEPVERLRRGEARGDRRESREERAERERRERLYSRGGYSGAYDFELEDPSLADELLDELIPPDVDWRRLVRRHPWPALVVAGLAGYLLGRSQGRALVTALTGLAVARVEERVLGLVDEELDQ
jgi:hypothetical protein